MQVNRRHQPVKAVALALILLLLVMFAASCTRLLEPMANQRPTPTPSAFVSVATGNRGTESNTSAETATKTDTGTDTDPGTDTDTDANIEATDEISATNPAIITPITTSVVTSSTAATQPAANPEAAATIAPAAASTVMSLTSNAEVALTLAQGEGYDNPSSPVDLIASYFNAVELADYQRAYNYWEDAPLSYADFAAGYAETVSVQVIIQPPTRVEGAAGSLYVEVPTFLVAHHTDGTIHSFSGCMTTRKSNVPAPDVPDPNWRLYAAQFVEVDNFTSIPASLAGACAS